ncbi:MAG: DMT family transporter [Gammaproteobacteria bacterium]|nr:DMT family transporter [Gammaproteobacteria bacterium]
MPPQTSRLANDHARGLVLAIVGILILSPDSLLVRLIAADQWTLLFWRGMMTFVTLTAFLLFSHRRDTLKRFHALGIKGLAIAALLALNTTLFVVSIRHTAVANTLVLVSVAPLLAAVFSSFFLAEHAPLRTWIATLVSVLSIGYIMREGLGTTNLIGDTAALGLALTLAAVLTLLRARRSSDAVPIVACSGLLLAVAVFPFSGRLFLSNSDWLYMSILGLFVIPVSFAFTLSAPKFLPAPEVGLVFLLETVLGPFLVWLVMDEEPPSATLVGGTVLVTTLALHAVLGLRLSSAVHR